jgi:hypothetical protein
MSLESTVAAKSQARAMSPAGKDVSMKAADIDGNRYQATASEDIGYIVCCTVNYSAQISHSVIITYSYDS